jgi:hypothetical protein
LTTSIVFAVAEPAVVPSEAATIGGAVELDFFDELARFSTGRGSNVGPLAVAGLFLPLN